MVYTEPIVTTQGNHFNGPKAVRIIFGVGKYVKIERVKKIPICITVGKPPHNVINNKLVPLAPKGDFLEPRGGVTISSMQPIIPYFGPFKKHLNHPTYNKNSDSDAHV